MSYKAQWHSLPGHPIWELQVSPYVYLPVLLETRLLLTVNGKDLPQNNWLRVLAATTVEELLGKGLASYCSDSVTSQEVQAKINFSLSPAWATWHELQSNQQIASTISGLEGAQERVSCKLRPQLVPALGPSIMGISCFTSLNGLYLKASTNCC